MIFGLMDAYKFVQIHINIPNYVPCRILTVNTSI